jgi:hypothetical protein
VILSVFPSLFAMQRVAALAMKRGKSLDFTGYWQQHIASTQGNPSW